MIDHQHARNDKPDNENNARDFHNTPTFLLKNQLNERVNL
jgi:hypothetical protein